MPDSDRKTCDRLFISRAAGSCYAICAGERTWSDRRSDSRENLAWNSRLDTGNKIFVFSGHVLVPARPDGIFFPLLILGAFIGGIFAMAAESFLGLDVGYMNNFVLLAMAGFFTAVVRAPLTGIICFLRCRGP